MKLIHGAGGGKDSGSGGRVAKEDANTLQSKSYAQVLDLISEGEIEGLADGLRSIFLDDTPLIGSDGTSNFSGVNIDFRNGSQFQNYIKGFPSSEHEVLVNVEVKKDTPVVRTISSSSINAVTIKISTPQMTYQDPTNGDLKGSEVTFAIEVNSNGSGWVQKANDTFIGKCVSKYIKSYRVELSGSGPHQVRVRRITADATTSNIQNKIYWESFGEVVDVKLRYPNSAICAMSIDAENFKSVPARSFDVKLLKIKVPSNYDPDKRTYNGIWDGTFQVRWTDNPAWIFYDLVTNERYGLSIPENQIDKWSLYKISKYCDELVPDGFGGIEPRFTCNAYFQTRVQAYTAIQDLASVFRSMAYWSGGLMTLSQDSPSDPVHLFNESNVVDGQFVYQGTSKKDRYTVALVTWNDPEDGYAQKIEYVENSELVAKYGVIQKEVVAFGCTSRGQAHRLGRWLIYTSQWETETVTFKTGIEASVLRPGQIIKVADSMRSGKRISGRVRSSTLRQITVDQNLISSSFSQKILLMMPDGQIVERFVESVNSNIVRLNSDLPFLPHQNSIWMLTSAEVEPQTFRIIGVKEDGNIYQVSALTHDPSKFDFVEKNISLEDRKITTLSPIPSDPTGLKVIETLYEVNGEVRVKATFSWDAQDNVYSYKSQYRSTNGNIVTISNDRSNSVEILNIAPGNYDFFVQATSSLGKSSGVSSIQHEILGKAYPPGNVLGFSLIPMADQAYLSWEKTSDLDVAIGGSVRIRFSPDKGAVWKDTVDVALLAGSSTRAQVPLMNGVYAAKFIDSSGNASPQAAFIETNTLEASKLNVVMSIDEHPLFPGTLDGMTNSSFYGGLTISAGSSIDDWTDTIDEVGSFDYMGGVRPQGEYIFSQVVDLTEIYTCNILSTIDSSAIDVADVIDMRDGLMDSWLDMDGENIDDVNAEIHLQTTDDDPNSPSAIWSSWKRFFVGQYKARGFRFKLVANSYGLNHNIVIKKLSLVIDMPDRVLDFKNLNSDIGGSSILFEAPFAEIPAIGVTGQNMQAGDYFTISSKNREGFSIRFFDLNGNPIVRTFDVIVKGYGRQVNV